MRKGLSLFVASLLATTSLYAYNLDIKQDWQIFASDKNLNASLFNKDCIDILWQYDTSSKAWKIYYPQGGGRYLTIC